MNLYQIEPYHPTEVSTQVVLEKLALKYGWGEVRIKDSGKPTVQKGYVSVSHTQDILIIAYDLNQEMGIDIECDRALSQNLIQRLNLDTLDPLKDWCLREAHIKLKDDKNQLFKALPPDLYWTEFRIKPQCRGFMVSQQPILHLEYKEESDL